MKLTTGKHDLVEADLEHSALRAAELVDAMQSVSPIITISIDGSLVKNAYFGPFLANAIGPEITVTSLTDLTGLGTARLAMVGLTSPARPA